MALSTLPAAPTREAGEAGACQLESDTALRRLLRFYRWQAWLYDWTRPAILLGRREIVLGLDLPEGSCAVDVGSGTGFALPLLLRRAAQVVAIEPSPEMRRQAERRISRLGLSSRVRWEAEAYDGQRAPLGADAVLFSYSLSMMPAYESALSRAVGDLRRGGSLAVVDFLDSRVPLFRQWLTRCHVQLGGERLEALKRLLPIHEVSVRSGSLWSYFLFQGRV